MLHDEMNRLFPDATFIGFTGTPLMKKNKATTLEKFGKYIHTYKFDQAVKDGIDALDATNVSIASVGSGLNSEVITINGGISEVNGVILWKLNAPYLKNLPTRGPINWGKVFCCDCVGGIVGGAAGYLGSSLISVIMQY